jgi:hypothetical protein
LLGHDIITKFQHMKANQAKILKVEVERDRVYEEFTVVAAQNAYCNMIQSYAVQMGIDKNGPIFVEALQALRWRKKWRRPGRCTTSTTKSMKAWR